MPIRVILNLYISNYDPNIISFKIYLKVSYLKANNTNQNNLILVFVTLQLNISLYIDLIFEVDLLMRS